MRSLSSATTNGVQHGTQDWYSARRYDLNENCDEKMLELRHEIESPSMTAKEL